MIFKVQFLNRKTGETYWKSVRADDEPEANKLAGKMRRQGFIIYKMTSDSLKTD